MRSYASYQVALIHQLDDRDEEEEGLGTEIITGEDHRHDSLLVSYTDGMILS